MDTGVIINKHDDMIDIIETHQLPDHLKERKQSSFNKLNRLKDDIKDESQLKKNIKDVIQLDRKQLSYKEQHKIREFLDYCMTKCIKEEKIEFMLMVADLLPDLIFKYDKSLVTNLVMQLTYTRVPSKWCEKEMFLSTRENLWSYKFPGGKSSPSIFDRLEKDSPHSATLCYVPLPGLCTYPVKSNALFVNKLSPFARLVISNSFDTFQPSVAYFKLCESPLFQALIKFKWHAFARWRFFGMFFVYLNYSAFFIAAISRTSRQLMIVSLVLGLVLMLFKIRYAIINVVNGLGFRFFTIPVTYLTFLVITLPLTVGFLFLFLEFKDNITLTILRYLATLFLWFGLLEMLLAFKNTGIFLIIVAQICRKMLWLLFFLAIYIVAASHSAMVLITGLPSNGSDEFGNFGKALRSIWFCLIGNYDSLDPWNDVFWVDISKIAFSILTNIIVLNIMIALVNSVYEGVHERAYAEWTMVRAQIVVAMELLFLAPSERQNRDYFPWTITYEASAEEVDNWPEKLKKNNIPIPWEDDSTDKIKRKMDKIKEMNKKMADELEKLMRELVEDKEIFD